MTPGAAIICGVPSGCAEQIIHLRPPQPTRHQFSHGFKRTESLHVENRLDRSVTPGCRRVVLKRRRPWSGVREALGDLRVQAC